MSNASEYAESVAKRYWDDYRAGHVFGVREEGEREEGESGELSAYDFLGPTSYVGKHAAWTVIVNPTPAQLQVMFADEGDAS